MSHPQPPQRQPTQSETEKYIQTLHYAAITAVIACPVIALLPPRKLDFYTIGLLTTTGYCSNYLVREQTGRSIWQHVTLPTKPPLVVPPEERANLDRELQRGREELRRMRHNGGSVSEEVSKRDAWKRKLEEEIKEDVAEGKGFGDMIYDQIYEVWNWGKRKEEDDEE
nr:hypothetical protein CFP56_73794 [Quercus suber]